MILYSEYPDVKEPVGFVCDVCGKKFVLENQYDRINRNKVEEQMGIVRVLRQDGTIAQHEYHVCSMHCTGHILTKYRQPTEVFIPAGGLFDRRTAGAVDNGSREAEPNAEPETYTDFLRGWVKPECRVTEEQQRKLGEKIFEYISWSAADPVKLITLAAVLMSFDKDMEREKGQ